MPRSPLIHHSPPVAKHIKQLHDALSSIAIFTGAEWAAFASIVSQVELSGGDFLSEAGRAEQNIYFIVSGVLRNYIISNSIQHTIAFHFPLSFTTAYHSLVTSQTSVTYSQALTNCTCLVIPYRKLNELFKDSLLLERIFRHFAELQYLAKFEREISLLTQTASQRYLALLASQPHLVQQL